MELSSEFVALVADARVRVKEADIHEVKRRLNAGEKLTLVDVREDSEWRRGRLPGALHLSKGIIERDIVRTAPGKSETLVLYCGGGYRSALAADNLQKMGYTNVISLSGGWHAWTQAGYPVECESRDGLARRLVRSLRAIGRVPNRFAAQDGSINSHQNPMPSRHARGWNGNATAPGEQASSCSGASD